MTSIRKQATALLLTGPLAMLGPSACAAGLKQDANVIIEIRKTESRPVIDGSLVDPCWQNQMALTNFTLNTHESTPASKQTTAYLCYDDEHLYVAVRCDEPNMDRISANDRPHDDLTAWTDDCVELFLAPRDGSYYQFLLTAANALLDVNGHYQIGEDGYVMGGFSEFERNHTWNCDGIETATRKAEDHWSLEIAVPFSQIGGVPRPGDRWRLNIAREETQLRELSTYSPLAGSFHQPEAFSDLTFQQDGAVLTPASTQSVALDQTPGADQAKTGAGNAAEPVVFVTNYLERGYPTTGPKEDQITDTIELFASWGEYEPATFSVRAGQDPLAGVKVRLTDDLKSSDGSVICRRNVDVRVVEAWKRWLTTKKYMYVERYLQNKAAVDIDRHKTQRFWLTVHVPMDTPGGTYQSKIRIVVNGATLKSLDLKVEVLPFQLMSEEGMGYFMYLPTWGIPPALRTVEYLEKIFIDMREHGMTSATLYPYGLPFGVVMDILRDTRMLPPGIPAIWLGADNVGPESWKEMLDEAKEKNWPELVLYLQDEPGDEERIKNAKRLFSELDQFKQKYPQYENVRATTAIGSTGIAALGELYDIWIAGAGFDKELARKASDMGKLLWSYDCGTAPVDAETSRYYFGLWCWKSGIKGCSYWAYSDSQNPSGIRDWDYISQHLDTTELPYAFVYPAPEGPVPSIGWEATREGIDDHKYLATLTRLMHRARDAGHTQRAESADELLTEIRQTVRVEAYQQATRAGAATGWRLGGLFHRPPPQAEIARDDYNQFRYRIAQQILKLQAALGP